jgi:hypothetical protein
MCCGACKWIAPAFPDCLTENQTMEFIWLLVAMPVVSFLCSAYLIAKGNRRKLPDCVAPLSTMGLVSAKNTSSLPSCGRKITWISMKECEDIIRTSSDVVFIDLGPPEEGKKLPIPAAHVLSISPSHVLDVVRWLPPETTVLLYGASELCASMIWTARSLAGVAPVYVVKAAAVHSKIA